MLRAWEWNIIRLFTNKIESITAKTKEHSLQLHYYLKNSIAIHLIHL